jgi:hypothetical protein
VAVPAVAVAALYGASMAGGFVFGNLVFGVRAVAIASWLVPVGWGPTTSAARKTGALLLEADRQ